MSPPIHSGTLSGYSDIHGMTSSSNKVNGVSVKNNIENRIVYTMAEDTKAYIQKLNSFAVEKGGDMSSDSILYIKIHILTLITTTMVEIDYSPEELVFLEGRGDMFDIYYNVLHGIVRSGEKNNHILFFNRSEVKAQGLKYAMLEIVEQTGKYKLSVERLLKSHKEGHITNL